MASPFPTGLRHMGRWSTAAVFQDRNVKKHSSKWKRKWLTRRERHYCNVNRNAISSCQTSHFISFVTENYFRHLGKTKSYPHVTTTMNSRRNLCRMGSLTLLSEKKAVSQERCTVREPQELAATARCPVQTLYVGTTCQSGFSCYGSWGGSAHMHPPFLEEKMEVL